MVKQRFGGCVFCLWRVCNLLFAIHFWLLHKSQKIIHSVNSSVEIFLECNFVVMLFRQHSHYLYFHEGVETAAVVVGKVFISWSNEGCTYIEQVNCLCFTISKKNWNFLLWKNTEKTPDRLLQSTCGFLYNRSTQDIRWLSCVSSDCLWAQTKQFKDSNSTNVLHWQNSLNSLMSKYPLKLHAIYLVTIYTLVHFNQPHPTLCRYKLPSISDITKSLLASN